MFSAVFSLMSARLPALCPSALCEPILFCVRGAHTLFSLLGMSRFSHILHAWPRPHSRLPSRSFYFGCRRDEMGVLAAGGEVLHKPLHSRGLTGPLCPWSETGNEILLLGHLCRRKYDVNPGTFLLISLCLYFTVASLYHPLGRWPSSRWVFLEAQERTLNPEPNATTEIAESESSVSGAPGHFLHFFTPWSSCACEMLPAASILRVPCVTSL